MSSLFAFTRLVLCGFIFTSSFGLMAVSSAPPSTKPSASKPLESPPPRNDAAPPHYKPTAKPELPPMLKPFLMPGVIGLQYGKWEGTDYLGYLSNNVGVQVEISKAENVPAIVDEATIAKGIADIFTKENIIPYSGVAEGPPLPFFHILMLVYPIDKDRYVIVGNGRLFEQIQVIRKEFIPAGFWQGITWENHDIALANGQQLNTQIQAVADTLGTAFVKRYRQYNLSKEGLPGGKDAPIPAPAPL